MNDAIEVRARCYQCFRPQPACFCDQIPVISNSTNILILQHPRERRHAFNTARIVKRALANVQVIAAYPKVLAETALPLIKDAALLYPGTDSIDLRSVAQVSLPKQLVVVDGTWHQAKTIVRDVPALKRLRKFGLSPGIPGRYRIRREPNDRSLSTLEAVSMALAELEPQTTGIDQLIHAFDAMVEQQLAHPNMHNHWRKNARRRSDRGNVPRALVQSNGGVVVAYGESVRGPSGNEAPTLVSWVAERVGTGETFAMFVKPDGPMSNHLLKHFELSADEFQPIRSHEEVCDAWRGFLQPDDTIAVYHQGTARLAPDSKSGSHRYVILKSIRWSEDGLARAADSLEETVKKLNIEPWPARCKGRAGVRLAAAVSLVRHLQSIKR